MSSILKALKKLETGQDQQKMVRSLSKAVRLQNARSHRSRSFLKGAGILVISVMLAAGGFIGMRHMVRKPEKNIATDLTKHSSTLHTEAMPTVDSKTTGKKQTTVPGITISPKPLAGQPSTRVSEKAETLPPKNAVPKREKQQAALKSQPAPTLAKASSASRFEEDGIKLSQDSGLKLMAIAWSAIPADRIAVINGRIVREGETLDGAFISRINENEVILQKGNELSKLMFRIQ